MAIQIVHASISENGNAGWDYKAQVGDQTGKEVCTRSWYERSWSVMLRYPDPEVRKKAAEIAVKLANSNRVGYDQSNRNSLYQALKKYNFDVDAYIKSGIKTETDCSAFMYACYACLLPHMRSDANAPSTHNWDTGMRAKFKSWGFEVHTESKYLTTDAYLTKGDIIVYESHHTVMANGNGSKAVVTPTSQTTTTTTPSKYTVGCYASNTTLNVRASASGTATVLGTIHTGDIYEVTTLNGKWGKIDFNGKTGWISLDYCTKATKCNANILKGQKAAVKFTGIDKIDGKKFDLDGERGSQTRKMAVYVLQTAMIKDYGSRISINGIMDLASKVALGGHYVERGEKQYMVTAAEILLYLLGKNPNGIEYPGEFGSGLEKAAGKSRITANDFLEYLK